MLRKKIDPDFTKVKVVDEEGNDSGFIEGFASVYNNVDLGGDVVRKGAFKKTIKERLKKGMILLFDSHAVYEGTNAVIGAVTHAEERDEGLWFHAAFSAVSRAQEVRTKVREKILRALSFGYDVIKSSPSTEFGEDVTELTELRLWEISVVPWGMNPKAATDIVKGIGFGQEFDFAANDYPFDPVNARKRVAEWAENDPFLYAKAFVWSSEENAQSPFGYALQVVDIIDGKPKYVLNAAKAALSRLRDTEHNKGAFYHPDAGEIEQSLKMLYQKVDEEFPEVEAPEDEQFKGLSELVQGVQDFALATSLRKLSEGMGTLSAK